VGISTIRKENKMAKKGFGCERPECSSSTGVCGSTTFGTGNLDFYGYWEFPCKECENAWKLWEKWSDKDECELSKVTKSIDRTENVMEITYATTISAYNIQCRRCNWVTMMVRPTNGKFVCENCGAHTKMGPVIDKYLAKKGIEKVQ